MLTLILGRAGSGKTDRIFRSLKAEVDAKTEGNILIVPEQYSHEAERLLAVSCGDTASLYAEVLSFSRLVSRVFAETGGMAERVMDGGGRMLAMSLAASGVASELKQYNVGGRRPDFLRSLLATYDELRSSMAGSRELFRASLEESGAFAGKLRDLSLIFEAYEAVKERSGCDQRDRLERLGEDIGRSSVGRGGVYIDGFTDFTAQEFRVVAELLKKCRSMTVCLTCESPEDTELLFRMPSRTARRLLDAAEEYGVEARTVICETDETPRRDAQRGNALVFMKRYLWDYDPPVYEGDASCVRVYAASPEEECAVAAARALEFVRDGCRFREIAVVSPVWDRYEPVLRGVFRKYGVPLGQTEKADILEKPVTAALLAALDVPAGDWAFADVFRYLKTGMAGIAPEVCDLLENYALKWSLRGERSWCGRDWTMPPEGYAEELSPEAAKRLAVLNEARRTFTEPLLRLREALSEGESALEKVRAVYRFMEDMGLYGTIERKRRVLLERGEAALAGEYRQLWDVLVNALQQFADILGEAPIGTDEFVRLLRLVLAQYQVGVIPASVDQVHGGNLTRVRPRGLKHLIVLGASDGALPLREREAGVFSQEERERLRRMGVELLDSEEDTLSRELYAIYASFTLPRETLTVTVPLGERRAFVVTRLMRLLGLAERVPGEEIRLAAAEPAFEHAIAGNGPGAEAARAVFEGTETGREELDAVRRAVSLARGRLSRQTAEGLYGRELQLSASRVDKFYTCRHAYFLRYGLRLEPRKKAGLDAPEVGTFMHFVLERAAREIERRGGYGVMEEDVLRDFVLDVADEYAERRLGGLENKSGRFQYLFNRLRRSAVQVALELLRELKNSQFRPMDFELSFSREGDLPPVEVPSEDGRVSIVGAVDRVDGWVRGDELYLRVVDYKTGKKALSLTDVWYGLGMQMLIYLFALERTGKRRYGQSVVPAGVLYAPARDVLVTSSRDLSEEQLQKELESSIRRSGLLLDDPEVVEAMEDPSGGSHVLPVKFSRNGTPSGECLASLEQLGKLSRHVTRLVGEMAREVREGSVEADPFCRGKFDSACVWCEYFDACHFGSGRDDKPRYFTRMKTGEFWEKLSGEGERK